MVQTHFASVIGSPTACSIEQLSCRSINVIHLNTSYRQFSTTTYESKAPSLLAIPAMMLFSVLAVHFSAQVFPFATSIHEPLTLGPFGKSLCLVLISPAEALKGPYICMAERLGFSWELWTQILLDDVERGSWRKVCR